jgi:hypothetical protein
MLADRADWTIKPPHRKPECIFDFDDGLRLIVSFDQFPVDNEIRLHVSASFPPGCLIHRVFQSLPDVATKHAYLTNLVMATVPVLARRTVKLRFVQIGDRGVLHFVGPTRKEWETPCTK